MLETVLLKAARLCDAEFGVISTREADAFRVGSVYSNSPEYHAIVGGRLLPAERGTVIGRTAVEGRIVHILDIGADPDYAIPQILETGGARTCLGVPLLREGAVVGVISLARPRVEAFTEQQIDLVSTFADQAVIAIENTRLITEQREALEQQTATAEVLQVINASPGNLTPVFEAMLEKAIRLCGGDRGVLWTIEGGRGRLAAARGLPAEFVALLRERGESGTNSPLQRVVQGEWLIEFPDTVEEFSRSGDPHAKGAVEAGVRSAIWVAIVKEGATVGAFAIGRSVIGTFSDKQIALLQNFAAQAVIAMENARLLNEQREALEQQTATAEVLQVINASPGNLAPVFDAMLERALRLCNAYGGGLLIQDGANLKYQAMLGMPTSFAALRLGQATAVTPDSPPGRMFHTGRTVQVVDTLTDPYFVSRPELRDETTGLGGARSVLNVPLLKDGAVVGAFVIFREAPGAWPARQIALLENFAAQAVIAMENARLLTETRVALEQQTATAEVLQVINSSPGDLAPVFEAMLEKATRLCEAAIGFLWTWDGEAVHRSAFQGIPVELMESLRQPFKPKPGSIPERIIAGENVISEADLPDAPHRWPVLMRLRARSFVGVALRKDDILLGGITIYRQEVRPFTNKQIALLENFAAQAIIAMENARLLHELRARTDELAQRQAELRVTFENMGDGVAMFDETQHLVAWNGKFQEIFDLPGDLLEQHRTYEEHLRFLAARGDLGAGNDTAEQIEELVATTSQPYGYERRRPDGRVIEIRRNPVPDGGFVLIFSDITERKRNEEEIRAARDAAEQASRTIEAAYRELKAAQANLIQAEKMASLGQLTAGIAHEIKNPLNFVNNFAELSGDLLGELNDAVAGNRQAEIDELTATLQGNLAKITEHGKRADGIVKAMLEHSRGSSAERRRVDLNALIDEALSLAYHGARAQDQTFNITLEREFGDGIAPIEVNPQDVTRAFLNLFSNAFYATARRARNGGAAGFDPTLKVTTRDIGEAVEINVRDNGIGISTDIRDKLFQPFFTTKPTGEGTGLGLSITYDIVTQQHGGTIAVESKVGEYSEFQITLPRRMAANEGGRA